MVTGKKT